nr:DUF4249 family protein [Maribacter sp. Hal144]
MVRGPDEQRVCYQTKPSEEIIQATTVGLQENRILRNPVRFIDRSNFIISHRYSILVKQYVQSVEAYNYYNTLKSFSNSESVFSEVQPGFLEGNIKSASATGQNALGYFEVASVSQQRIYFDYEDLFPGEPLPVYPISCVPTVRSISHRSYCDPGPGATLSPLSLIESIHGELVAYYSTQVDSNGGLSSATTVPRACGDCTLFGSDEVPDFWIE